MRSPARPPTLPLHPTVVVFALLVLTLLAVFALPAARVRADAGPAAPAADDLKALATQATSDNADEAKAATARLRAAGPDGLKALLDANADAVARHRSGNRAGVQEGDWQRVRGALDAVAAQRDAYASGLYWYTDLAEAERAAKASGKPILSLRLLGRLDTELSCANSRFFRTVLYANADVSAALRERFVLHWQSVRPVPRITIDFGDGRVVERTITGNSIHYLLDPDGNVIDALPGLYGARPFLERLTEAAVVEKGTRGLAAADRAQFLRNWHTGKAADALRAWQDDLRAAGALPAVAVVAPAEPIVALAQVELPVQQVQVQQPPPAAARAGLLAPSKARAELPAVRAIAAAGAAQDPRLGALAGPPAVPPGPAANPPPAARAAPLARGKADVERPVVAAVAPNPGPAGPPPAARAAPLARGKAMVERPMVVAVGPNGRLAGPPPAAAVPVPPKAAAPAARPPVVRALTADELAAASTDEVWQKVAALHADDARLDDGSRALMATKVSPDLAMKANGLADSKKKVESPLLRVVRNFERSVAEDTVRNEYTFHRTIHAWLAAGAGTPEAAAAGDVTTLNERVYAELFLTPSTDPWLGLVPPDTYTALENDGFCPTK